MKRKQFTGPHPSVGKTVTASSLQQFLQIKNPKFKDFINLRVGGKDQFSDMRIAALRKAGWRRG
jgi:hypothetical protein